jgi:hypothetical protein
MGSPGAEVIHRRADEVKNVVFHRSITETNRRYLSW